MKTEFPFPMKTSYLVSVVFLGIVSGAIAVQPDHLDEPSWALDSNVTRLDYYFQTNDLNPDPDFSSGVTGTVNTVIVTGLAGGFLAPGSDLAGLDLDGAFQFSGNDPRGSIGTTLEFAPSPAAGGESYTVDYYIRVVGYAAPGFVSLPSLAFGDGLVPVSSSIADLELLAMPAPFDGDSWVERVWTGSFEGITGNQLGFSIEPGIPGSALDLYQVFTRYTVVAVPEPSAGVLLLGVALGGLMRRRR